MKAKKSTPKDPINPAHYRSHPSGVECIEVIEALPYNVGAAIKYLWRAGLKTADPLEDLKKALWHCWRAGLKSPEPIADLRKAKHCIEREIARLEKKGGAS